MHRIILEGSSPNFIGCWGIEKIGLCDDIVGSFEENLDKLEQGKSAGAVVLDA